MTTFTYDQVTPEMVQALVKELQAAGSTVRAPFPSTPHEVSNSWTITGHGVTADATYDPSAAKLTVDIRSKPFFVAASFINTGILKALGRA